MSGIQKISESIEETLKEGEFHSLTSNNIEFLIDNSLSDGVFKDFPIIGTLIGIIKTVVNVHDRLFIKKLMSFLYELKDTSIKKRKKLIEKIDESNKYRTKVGEKLLFIIDRCNDNEKAEIIGKLFRNFLIERISYDEFTRAASCIESVFLPDLLKFVDERWEGISVEMDTESLLAAGIVTLDQIEPIYDKPSQKIENSNLMFKVTNIGNKIREILTSKPLRKQNRII